MKLANLALLGTALAIGAVPLAAQSTESISIHGYGSWVGGRTNHNRYLAADSIGDYSNASMALNLAAVVSPSLRVVMQVSLDNSASSESTELDYGFFDLRLAKGMHLRAGQVKQPFGLYTEILKVGTLRPALFVPRSVYGENGTNGEAFRGAGLSGSIGQGTWQTDWDVYGGGLSIKDDDRGSAFINGDSAAYLGAADETFERNVVGGRLRLATPIEGLSVGVSSWRGDFTGEGETITESRRVLGGQLELVRDRFTFRNELVAIREGDDYRSTGGYSELGVMVTPRWQLLGRWDQLRESLGLDDVSRPSLLEHRDATAGVSYWPTSQLALRAELHDVTGNRYAQPDAMAAALANGTALANHTRALMLGAQFSF